MKKLIIHKKAPRLTGRVALAARIRPADKKEALGAIMEILCAARMVASDAERSRARLCLDEALVNAIEHGNRGDARKSVNVELRLLPKGWNVLIEDEGEGFHAGAVPNPDDPATLALERGRGILLMRRFMDEVYYFKSGRAVLLGKKAAAKNGRKVRKING